MRPRLEADEVEDLYFAWLEENCKCDIEEEGCSCPDIESWWESYLSDLSEANEEEYA